MSFENAPKRGVTVHYGPRAIDSTDVGAEGYKGRVVTRTLDLTYADIDNPTAINHGTYSGLHAEVPAGAVILSARVIVTTAFNGTSPTINFGLVDADGAAIDVDGFIAGGSLASNAVVAGSGALVGDALSAKGWLYAINTATDSTAGAATLVLEYVLV